MKIKEITSCLESVAPLAYQESYDNCGLIIGDKEKNATGALLTLDVTEDVVNEAIKNKWNLIIAHHPVIFSGIKKLTGSNDTERIIIKAIKNDIAIYAAHTNLDAIKEGVNGRICSKIGLTNCKTLAPVTGELKKIVVFVPHSHAEKVRNALCKAGAGQIGKYDYCTYNTEGKGTFRAGDGANPFVGDIGKIHFENEIRIETIFPKSKQAGIIAAMLESHPYEEVAYDIYSLDNKLEDVGIGMIGELEKEEDCKKFLTRIKKIFQCGSIKYTVFHKEKIKKVAVCGGSGSFLIKNALAAKADIFITGDVKYHNFFDAENRMIIADIGHFESEQFTKEIFYDLLNKKFPTFAVNFSKINTNPINYL